MKKINGLTIIDRDDVGEFGYVNGKLIRSACNAFFARRGIPIFNVRNEIHAQVVTRRRARRKSPASL